MCDTAVVVTSSGVLFAKSSDRDPNEAQHLEWRPREKHASGARVRCTWMSIPQARETHAILISRPFWMWGAEIGSNEHGVTIGNEAVFTLERVPETGLTGMDLLRLALERAASAKEAVETIVALIEMHGQGGRCGHEVAGFRYFSSFIVADRREAFVLETSRHRCEVQSVSGARSISNGLTLMRGDPVRTFVAEAVGRRSRTESAVSCAGDLGDLMTMLRDHGHGRSPRYRVANGAMSAPCMHAGGLLAAGQTVASWVAKLGPEGVSHWVTATAAPCTAIFKPVGVDDPLEVGPLPTDREDGRSLFWRHERLHRAVMHDPERLLPLFAGERDSLEKQWLAAPPSPRDAFAEAGRRLAEWTARVETERAHDRRPVWVRRYWQARELASRGS